MMNTPAVKPDRAFLQNRLLPSLTLAIVAAFAALYASSVPLYAHILGLWSFVMADHPFIDAEYVTAQIACWSHGIDVYRVNTCDPLGRLHDYSPLWLRMGFLPPGPQWAKILGLAQDVLYAASLGFLPRAPGRAAGFLLIAAAASPTALFALERGNVDLLMVVLTIAALALWERSLPARAAAYAIVLLGFLLKFYPLVLLARAMQETPRIFLAVTAAAAVTIGVFVAQYGGELRLALHNVPAPSDFGDGFSSHQLGNGLAVMFGHREAGLGLTLLADAAASVIALRIATCAGFAAAYDALSPRAAACLLAGAGLFCGCFVAGPSVGYRAIVLMPALPGCLLMAQAASGRIRTLLWVATIAMVLALWNFLPMMALGPKAPLGHALGALPFLAIWATRELLWWSVFTLLLATILRYAESVTPPPHQAYAKSQKFFGSFFQKRTLS